jgi:hypothetical protein
LAAQQASAAEPAAGGMSAPKAAKVAATEQAARGTSSGATSAAAAQDAPRGKVAAADNAAPAQVPTLCAPPMLSKRQELHAKVKAEGRATTTAWWQVT